MKEVTTEEFEERWELAMERIRQIPKEQMTDTAFAAYFAKVAGFLLLIDEQKLFLEKGGLKTASLEELERRNHGLYADILPEHYEESYANPAYSVKCLGTEFGGLLSALYKELRSLVGFVHEGRIFELAIRGELFLEIYAAFVYEWEEEKRLPAYQEIRGIFYWFLSDYADVAAENRVRELVVPEDNFAVKIIMESDLSDLRYLFAYGEYVSENEMETARFLTSIPASELHVMADTYTEGYRKGFEVTGRDLSIKNTVDIRYQLGFEPMMRRAVENFGRLGLEPVCYRAAASLLYNPSLYKVGFYGGCPNRQYEFDHKDDRALFLDKNYNNRRLEVMHTAFEQYRKEAAGYAGPAVVETFGEKDFEPVNKPENIRLSEEQNGLMVEYRTQLGELQRNYIIEEERSFTIIAFPTPEIKAVLPEDTEECFREFFREVIRINTLDYEHYRKVQQTLIDVLDTAVCCEIRGREGNRTDLKVQLCRREDPERETIFENCVADVNIPVGEVFTSPLLKGTEGILSVSRVFLNGLEYKNLTITFSDGMISDYTCDNYSKEEENREFVRENVLFRHKTLPMGEFAIGTNTTAYTVARKYGVENKLPILIAEKMGPHFAVGDTCYSHAEDIRVYNPDGKEIIARDNEVSRLRTTDPARAYYNCHTDITIPYDELGELVAVREDGVRIPLIKEGRFVLEGTE
ncbi:MAG: aminopeptidase, partial [Roseburia sp.]|nr:aminopeptidase [Roseburia sp.]